MLCLFSTKEKLTIFLAKKKKYKRNWPLKWVHYVMIFKLDINVL